MKYTLERSRKESERFLSADKGSEEESICYKWRCYCEKTDYESLIKTILEIFEDTEGIKVNAIEINRENDNTVDLSWNYIIPFFILFIPISQLVGQIINELLTLIMVLNCWNFISINIGAGLLISIIILPLEYLFVQ